MKKRVYFEKKEDMKYLSHLDFLRFLERLFKIADIPLVYSNGFNPRPKLSFGSPISIGEEVFYEPFDIELSTDINDDILVKNLNYKAPKGFNILKSETIDGKTSISSSFNATEFILEFELLEKKNMFINLLINGDLLEKKIKNGVTKLRDLRLNLVSWKENENSINLVLNNISPNAFLRMVDLNQENIKIKRIKYLNI